MTTKFRSSWGQIFSSSTASKLQQYCKSYCLDSVIQWIKWEKQYSRFFQSLQWTIQLSVHGGFSTSSSLRIKLSAKEVSTRPNSRSREPILQKNWWKKSKAKAQRRSEQSCRARKFSETWRSSRKNLCKTSSPWKSLSLYVMWLKLTWSCPLKRIYHHSFHHSTIGITSFRSH